jgi:hypothetical protein
MAWHNSPLRNRSAPVLKTKSHAVVKQVIGADDCRAMFKIYMARLKAIPIDPKSPQEGIDKRNAYIKTVVGEFVPFIRDAIDKKADYGDNILVELMIWLFNAGDMVNGIELALLLIDQGQSMPDNFSANMPTFVCDQVYDWANGLLAKNESATPYIDTVANKIAILEVPIVVYSKILAMAAKHKLLDNTPESLKAGIRYCEQAMRVNPDKHGVKSLLGKLQYALKV